MVAKTEFSTISVVSPATVGFLCNLTYQNASTMQEDDTSSVLPLMMCVLNHAVISPVCFSLSRCLFVCGYGAGDMCLRLRRGLLFLSPTQRFWD